MPTLAQLAPLFPIAIIGLWIGGAACMVLFESRRAAGRRSDIRPAAAADAASLRDLRDRFVARRRKAR